MGNVSEVKTSVRKKQPAARFRRSTRVGTLIVATIYLQLIQIDTCFEVYSLSV